jgi:hypothetical protein
MAGFIRIGVDDTTTSAVQSKLVLGSSVDLTSAATLDVQAQWNAANSNASIKNDLTVANVINAS